MEVQDSRCLQKLEGCNLSTTSSAPILPMNREWYDENTLVDPNGVVCQALREYRHHQAPSLITRYDTRTCTCYHWVLPTQHCAIHSDKFPLN